MHAADKPTRLAVIAGPVDTDGCYVRSRKTYHFIRHGEEHKPIVHNLKTSAAELWDLGYQGRRGEG